MEGTFRGSGGGKNAVRMRQTHHEGRAGKKTGDLDSLIAPAFYGKKGTQAAQARGGSLGGGNDNRYMRVPNHSRKMIGRRKSRASERWSQHKKGTSPS